MDALHAARDRIIVALDVPGIREAEDLVERLGDSVGFYKIGMELTYSGGLPLVNRLVKAGKRVFLDLKLHDTPNTVEMATRRVADLGATFLTVHAYPQTMIAALKGCSGSPLKVLGVTVMTSMDDDDLLDAGYTVSVAELVRRRALQAQGIGLHGLICSAMDITSVREVVGTSLEIVTPGIRPAGSEFGDQKRVVTPAMAIEAGADYLVIGRPITAVAEPRAAAEAILNEIAEVPSQAA